MRELLLEILGWLGYLERPTVLLQLTVVLVVMIGTHQARLCKLLLRWPAALCTPLGACCA
jgi:potassium-dependent mechanosensitive channel